MDKKDRVDYNQLQQQVATLHVALSKGVDIQVIYSLVKGIETYVARHAKTGNGITG